MKRAEKNLRTIRKKLTLKWRQDMLYNSHWMTKFSNKLMQKGEKYFIQKKIQHCFKMLKLIQTLYPKVLFFEMLELIKPSIEMIPRKMGKTFRYIPTVVTYPRNYKLVLSFVTKEIRNRPERLFFERFQTQWLNLILHNKSSIFNDIEMVYQLAHKNKAFTNFAWTFYKVY